MNISRFGADNGRPIIYFHGVPGAPEECEVFHQYGKQKGLTFLCFERFSIDSSIKNEAYYRLLAEEISKRTHGEKVDFVGFSIGAFIALQTCRHLANGVGHLHLVSAAAPLGSGDFLDHMAGKHVFRLAKGCPPLFMLLSYWQRWLTLLAPDALYGLLFANAIGEDKTLAASRNFKALTIKALRSCFIDHPQGYVRDIEAYVKPWDATLSEVNISTHIWHGAEDNWSPVITAEYLGEAIPSYTHVEIFNNLSHYSCLYQAAPKICEVLSTA